MAPSLGGDANRIIMITAVGTAVIALWGRLSVDPVDDSPWCLRCLRFCPYVVTALSDTLFQVYLGRALRVGSWQFASSDSTHG